MRVDQMSHRPKQGTLFLLDAPGFIFRAYHALPPLTTASGLPTGAVYGFVSMFLKLVDVYQPDYIAALFDKGRPRRTSLYELYKANRPPRPEELKVQFSMVREVLGALGVSALDADGYEADDLIATLARQGIQEGLEITIVSSDKDLMQLVGPGICLLDTMKSKQYDVPAVIEKFDISPESLGDYLALVGDSSDNVPGVPGVGPKTAVKLLKKWGSLDNILAHIDEIPGKKIRENLGRSAEQARLSRVLVTLDENVPLAMGIDNLRSKPIDLQRPDPIFEKFELLRLVSRFVQSSSTHRQNTQSGSENQGDAVEDSAVESLHTPVQLDEFVERLSKEVAGSGQRIALDLEWSDGRVSERMISGLAIGWAAETAIYVSLENVDEKVVWRCLAPLLESPADRFPKVCHDHKAAVVSLERQGISLRGVVSDPMLASYVLDPSRRSHDLEILAQAYLDESPVSCGQRALSALRLASVLDSLIASKPSLRDILKDIEMPLAEVLAKMEATGCLIDRSVLEGISQDVDRQLAAVESEIQEEAGWPVNVDSPKQVQRLLFDQLGLPTGKKTKTGFSTNADVLADLAIEHEIAAKIEIYRGLAKLKGTYLDALPRLVTLRTGRVHTTFNQAVAATGRLSSSDPNLQNIPIRNEIGKRIRSAFVAPAGRVLLSADYSQIELRILAHLSRDPVLMAAFHAGEDVHVRSAAEVFHVDPSRVTRDQRRVAKAVNFGVVYGQSDYGLARQLRIPRGEAHRYIESYFRRYCGVRDFMNRSVEEARREGIVRTLMGRERSVQGLDSRRWNTRSAAERIVRNTPIQGSCADLLKVAMIRIYRTIIAEELDAPMILSVHDELVFEVAADDVERVISIVRQQMSDVYTLIVPLKVDIGIGQNWAIAH